MIQVTPQMKVLVAVQPADFRCGIDGLARVCRQVLRSDPFSGAAFVFRNRRRTASKVLIYDGQGFWLCHNHHESYCTSFGSSDRLSRSWPLSRFLAARSTRVSQRLQCFAGGSLGTS